jgi:diphosphomevalonate decarboxylase
MIARASAIAHPNIALAKYWGKAPGAGNVPAVPSLSVTLAGLATRTTVTFDRALAKDEVILAGAPQTGAFLERASALLDRVRAATKRDARARVESANDFPTASGLASSASGFAALAVAAARAAGLDASQEAIADLARQSSASAARSLFGGFVELVPELGPKPAARVAQVAPKDALPLRVLVCVVTEAAKDVGSTEGMQTTRDRSPYYGAWLEEAPRLFAGIREALVARDLPKLCELSERSALAMHASAMAAGVVYFGSATLDVYRRVRELRAGGALAFATMDAGPHVKVLTSASEAAPLAAKLGEVPGVLRVITAQPGDGAREEAAR